VTGRDAARGRKVVDAIGAAGGQGLFVQADVRLPGDCERVVSETLRAFGGRLDILFNNAGMGDLATIEETSLADWERTVAIDQTGVFLGMKTCADALNASGHASVINVSSIFGTSGGFGISPATYAYDTHGAARDAAIARDGGATRDTPDGWPRSSCAGVHLGDVRAGPDGISPGGARPPHGM
jgi:NAD(P)-dependent dehydrogenase (short-subunit alcohol dehydrogenase family)